jgi:VanZ family protein
MVIIFVQSSFPSISLPEVEIISADKIIHMGVYGMLAALCYISLIHLEKNSTLTDSPFSWSLVITSLYGITDEFHQYFVPNRSAEMQDWLADFAGAVIAVLIIKYYMQNRYKLFKRYKNSR